MSDDEEDTGRSYRNFSDTSHKKYDSRKSYFDSEKLGDGKSLKIEIKSRSDQSGSLVSMAIQLWMFSYNIMIIVIMCLFVETYFTLVLISMATKSLLSRLLCTCTYLY
jgi:hypothetical protein